MVKLFIFKHVIRNGLLARNVFSFVPLNDNIGLPFPLYVSYAWKTLLASSFLLTLFEGSRLRKITISYMLSREANLGPINLLIWVDQAYGLLSAPIIIARIVFLLAPFPVSSISSGAGSFCKFLNFVGGLYVAGSYMWGCCIAVFRVLFVKAQTFLKNRIGVRTLLNLMLFLGTALVLLYSTLSVLFDDEIPSYKMCTHHSKEDFQIMQAYLQLTDPSFNDRKYWKSKVFIFVSIFGAVLTLAEILSYIILYHHVWQHNNTVNDILDPKVIKMRAGLFATWLMEVVYIIFGGFLLFIISDNNLIREVVTCVKLYDYFLIPFVQVYTSAPIKRYMTSRSID